MPASGVKKRKTEILVSLLFLLLTIGALGTSTLAWFSTNRQASVNLNSITVRSTETVEIFQYKGNYSTTNETRSYDGWDYSKRSDRTFTSFETDFENVDSLTFSHLSPRVAYTFAFRTTRGVYTDLNYTLLGFECSDSHSGSNSSIYLSEAIAMYFSSYFYTDVGTDTLSEVAASHFHNPSPVDCFNQSGSSSGALSLVSLTYQANQILTFFTLVCSDDSSTYYTYDSSSALYSKDSNNGDSNVYKNLHINFDPIEITGATFQ